jgi:hypothetical protein
VRVTVCAETGLLATDYCPITHPEWFAEEEVPKRRCPLHSEPLRPVLICAISGKLATPACPPQAVVTQTLPQSQIPKEACPLHAAPSPEDKGSLENRR